MAFSKTATLILLFHTFIIYFHAYTIQYLNIHDEKILSFPPLLLTLFQGFSYVIMSGGIFCFTMFINYCCVPRKSRVGIRRHVLSVVVFAPILAWVGGRSMGWLESPTHAENVFFAHACYSQLQPTHPHVLTSGLWCEYTTGLTFSQAQSEIGIRRKRLEYVEYLAKACQEGLRDIEHFDSATAGVGWMGKREWSAEEGFGRGERLRKGESRNGEREYLRRAFEDCHARFGVEIWMEWGNDGIPAVKLKTPRLEGTMFTGDFIDIDTGMADPMRGF